MKSKKLIKLDNLNNKNEKDNQMMKIILIMKNLENFLIKFIYPNPLKKN